MTVLPSLAATIARLANETISVSRPGASSIDATGTASRATATTFTARAAAQRPASRGALMHLSEGDRARRTCEVWSSAELRFRDLVTLGDGEVYELQHVEPWSATAGFWAAVGVKTQQ